MSNQEAESQEEESNPTERNMNNTLNWFLFENKMRKIIQDTVSPLFLKDDYTSERLDDINLTLQLMKAKLDELEKDSIDHTSQFKRADLMYIRVDEIDRTTSKHIEEIKFDISSIRENRSMELQKIVKLEQEVRNIDEKISRVVGNINHSRETILELKSQVYREISAMKEHFYSEIHSISEEQRNTKLTQETCVSQLENHKSLLNDLDTVMEKINLDMTHKFNLTIKGLQEEKLDK